MLWDRGVRPTESMLREQAVSRHTLSVSLTEHRTSWRVSVARMGAVMHETRFTHACLHVVADKCLAARCWTERRGLGRDAVGTEVIWDAMLTIISLNGLE